MVGKVWLITGCSSGFGRAFSEELLKTDAKLVATARDVSKLKGLESENSLLLKLDVTKPEDIQNAINQTINTFGRIDVLVNNAGYGVIGAVEECSMDSIRRMFDTNLFGLISATQAVLPIMRSQNSGHIFNISSVGGFCAIPGGGMYNATKFAVEGLSEALAMEVEPFGIKVTLIEPGPFRTDFAGRSLDPQPEIKAYEATAGQIRPYLQNANGNQAGDPVKAARILIDIANNPNPPLHMPLGNAAIDRIRDKLKTLWEGLDQVEIVARSADFGG
jgi:NADP-dependent 3-hydroxy acid dehydrogenase YdfG